MPLRPFADTEREVQRAGSLRMAQRPPLELAQVDANDQVVKRLGMTELEKLAASAFAIGNVEPLLEHVRARAEALCSEDGYDVSVRMLSKRIASTEAAVELLDVMLGRCLAARDFEAQTHIERLSRIYHGRLMKLMELHTVKVPRSRYRPKLAGFAR